ncbi:hypothetical protein FSP39_021799 [Pinctada imbricata]|uniref:DNA 3'-5' helicase n=1 Tax=Pinctada imbricata TaxID=66713 RepID=A0AA88YW90_PINIB|nr:hypothetical protein FSP39_021799 [Pinctada imbricata]
MSKCDRLDAIIKQLGEELLNKMDKFPVTIVYINNLDSVGYCYELMSSIMLDKQYVPVDHRIPENRIFAQYHRQYTKKMKDFIVNEIRKEYPKVRLVFATVALGMGLDAPSVQQIIHLQPPTTMEKYMQEIGRSGRNGQLSVAKMYYTTRDIASNRKGLSPAMRSFCLSKKCLRQEIVSYFGFGNTLFQGEKRSCCSNCNL